MGLSLPPEEETNAEGLPLLPEASARRQESRSHLANLSVISFAFFCVFFSFGTTQVMESSLVPGRLGYWCLASLYGTMCFSSLFLASPVVNALGEPRALFLGASTYVVFVAANIYPDWITLIPASAVLGVGAGVLWTAAGAYITAAGANYAISRGKPLKSEMGLFNGIFAAARTLASVIGNVTASVIFIFGQHLGGEAKAAKVLFYSFTAVGAFGSFIMILLRNEKCPEITEFKVCEEDGGKHSYQVARKDVPEPSELRKIITKDQQKVFSIRLMKKKAIELAAMHADPRLSLLIPLFIYSGYEQAFVSGDFTKEIIKNYLDLSSIGFVFAWYSLVMSFCSALLGRLSDRMGRRLFLVIGFACHLPFYVFFGLLWPSTYIPEEVISQHPLGVYLAITLLSIGDSCFLTLPPILMSVFFTKNAEPAFANYKFYQSLGSVIGFILGPLLLFIVKVFLLTTALCLALLLMIILDQKIVPLDKT